MIAASHFRPLSSRRFMCVALSAMLLIMAIILRHSLTRTMALHMLAHIPMIVTAGVLAARGLESRSQNRPVGPVSRALAVYRRFDEYGVPGLLLASFAGAFWMIPRALDEVLSSPYADAWKFISLFVIGMVLRDALTRAKPVIRLFFLGNFCWMAAVVGIVYQNIPSRLCNFYLASDQQVAGIGLVALSVLLPLAWLLGAWKRVRVFLRDT